LHHISFAPCLSQPPTPSTPPLTFPTQYQPLRGESRLGFNRKDSVMNLKIFSLSCFFGAFVCFFFYWTLLIIFKTSVNKIANPTVVVSNDASLNGLSSTDFRESNTLFFTTHLFLMIRPRWKVSILSLYCRPSMRNGGCLTLWNLFL